ncbi:MAG: methionyl-tRNA formyltransferase [bacterium]|nr:methionyl-tRNA formyltransferase [bacterium]
MKLVYFGTPDFAAKILHGLLSNPLEAEVALVVTGKSKPRGRHSLVPTPVAQTAQEFALPVFECDSPKDPLLVQTIQEIQLDLGVIVAWRILPEAVFAAPKLGTINLHGSLLPLYRGAAPVQRAVWNGARETGLTVFRLDRNIDTGNILLSKSVEVSKSDTSGDIFEKFVPVGIDLLREAIHRFVMGIVETVPQPMIGATPAPKIKPEERWIDWTQPVEYVRRHIHALSPEPGAVTIVDKERVLLYRVAVDLNATETAPPGTIRIEKKNWRVRCGDGWLQIIEAAREGRKVLTGSEFANGMVSWNGKRFIDEVSPQ